MLRLLLLACLICIAQYPSILLAQTCPQTSLSGSLDSSDPISEFRLMHPTLGCVIRPVPPLLGGQSEPLSPPWLTFYDTYEFTINVPGIYTLNIVNGASYIGNLYENSFNVNDPCNNLLQTAADNSSLVSPTLTINVSTVPATYVLLTAGDIPTVETDYEWTFTTPIGGAILAAGPTSCISDIPTLSQWGLIIFGLTILNLGVVLIHRKRELIIE